jgi:hypothetical protein
VPRLFAQTSCPETHAAACKPAGNLREVNERRAEDDLAAPLPAPRVISSPTRRAASARLPCIFRCRQRAACEIPGSCGGARRRTAAASSSA